MTTRTVNNFKTLRQILEYNDRQIQLKHIANSDNQNAPIESSPDVTGANNLPTYKRNYSVKKTTLLQVLDWNAVVSNDKLFSCMMLLLVSIVAQLIFSYISFALVNVQQSIPVFYISQGLNLVFSYAIPLSLLQDLDEVFENPFSELSKEVNLYRQLRICVLIQSVCIIVSILALVKLFTGGPFIELRINYRDMTEVSKDMTTFIRILQIISFQLTLINLALASINLFMTDRKIRRCFNRIEKMQQPEDMQAMFNSDLIEMKFNHVMF